MKSKQKINLLCLGFLFVISVLPACAQSNGSSTSTLGENKMNISFNNHTYIANLYDNSSTRALLDLLVKGPITIDMHDYGNMEKVGSLPQSLPRNDTPTNTGAGDLILYQGISFVIYYGTNSWNFTPLGKIPNVTTSELKTALGNGNVTVTLSL